MGARGAMWFVKLSIPGDKFFDAMYDMSGWLADARIDTANFTYSRDPAGEIRPENRSIRLTLKDGRTLNGRFLNHDTFSIQLIDASDKLLSIDKSNVRESTILSTSPMPSFRDKLSPQELTDVVAYLSSLKGRP